MPCYQDNFVEDAPHESNYIQNKKKTLIEFLSCEAALSIINCRKEYQQSELWQGLLIVFLLIST